MAKTKLASMSVDALLKLRDEIDDVLSRKADELTQQLSRLSAASATQRRQPRKAGRRRGRKVAPKYCHPDQKTLTWTGRGRKPYWVVEWLASSKGSLDQLAIKK